MEPREYLIYFALKNNGDRNLVHRDLITKPEVDEKEALDQIKKIKSKVLTYIDKDYPEYLKYVFCAPIVLFYYGDISLLKDRERIAGVVGSRDCSNYTREKEYEIVKDMAKDWIIISGLAKGVDAVAHQAAIDGGGKTIAVLGSGIDNCYPPENIELYEEIKKNHLLISEYPFMSEPLSSHFPFRNRIIAHLSKFLFVPEGKMRSGTSITVAYASNTSDFLVCLPQRADQEYLNNDLIKQGAYLVENFEDIKDCLEDVKTKNINPH